jgi:hypothetical protein
MGPTHRRSASVFAISPPLVRALMIEHRDKELDRDRSQRVDRRACRV